MAGAREAPHGGAMSPEVIGSIVATLVAIGAAAGGVAGARAKRRASERPPPPDEELTGRHRLPEVTGRHRLVDQLGMHQASIDTLELVTELHRQNAQHSRDHARDAVSRETIAAMAETVDAIWSRVQRLTTRDDLGAVRQELQGQLALQRVEMATLRAQLERRTTDE